MNYIDVLLVLIILASVWIGSRRGLLLAGADVLTLAVSLVAAFFLYPPLVAFAERQGLQWGVWLAPAAFLALYLLSRILLGVLFARVFSAVPPRVHAHGANRFLGILPGGVNGLINATIVSMIVLVLPISDELTRAARESLLVERFAAPAEWIEARLRPIFDPAIDRTLTRLTVRPGSRERVDLPYTVKNPKPRPDLEAKMLELVNEERRLQGLSPLRADPEVTRVARAHSSDMFARGYFSHIAPEGADPFDRMRKGGIRFLTAGENLALARTLSMAHQGLMDSPGHRANILRPTFGRLGIGILDGGRYGLMVTQNFRN